MLGGVGAKPPGDNYNVPRPPRSRSRSKIYGPGRMGKDIKSPFKHIRITDMAVLDDVKTFPGVKAIVKHTWGKKDKDQAKPHFHIWWEGDAVTSQCVKDRLKRHSLYIATNSGSNGFWIVKAHDSYDKWATYVMGNPSAEVILDDSARPLPPPVAWPVIAAGSTPGAAAAPVVVLKEPSKRLAQRVRFVKHLEQKGWHTDDVKIWNIHEKFDELCDELTEWSENAFTTPNGAVTVSHALWIFAETPARNYIKEKTKEHLRKSSRLFSPS